MKKYFGKIVIVLIVIFLLADMASVITYPN
jgi:hypothetical protein